MSAHPTPETLAERIEALNARRVAEGKPPLPRWRAVIEASARTEEAVGARREIEMEIRKARAVERIELGLDEPPADAWGDAA